MGERRRSWWGWGWADEALTSEQVDKLGSAIARRFPTAELERREPPALDSISLPAPRVDVPAALRVTCSTSVDDRAAHTYGKSFRDIVRALHGDLEHPPDVVAFPQTESDVTAVMDWCA